MSDDQNPQHNDDTSGHDHAHDAADHTNLPAPATPAPRPAASSKLPPMSSIPLTPVVGGRAALRPDGDGENVAQKPWFWFLVALLALLIAAIGITQCSGSDDGSTSTDGDLTFSSGDATTDTADGTALGDSTTSTSSSTTVAAAGTTVPPVTTAPPIGSVPGTGAPTGNITPQQLTGLQAQCVYGADAASCATLTAAGYTADNNYGLGDSLKGSDDATLSTRCTSGVDQLACLELASRHPSSPNDQSTAEEFANAVVAGDVATVRTLAAPYVVDQNPQLTGGPYTAGPDIPGTKFNGGKFSFKVQASGMLVCWVSNDQVVYCLVNPNG